MKKVLAFIALGLLVSNGLMAQGKKRVKKKKATANQEVLAKEGTYRLVLSFISKGAGLDNATHDKVIAYAAAHPKKPVYETHRWGREGEVDYCFKLSELTADEQKLFVKDIEKMIPDKTLVLVQENHTYVKKGR
ncbi:MAG: hypothetical protein ACXVC6_10470 [Bacteroidia bacterium]